MYDYIRTASVVPKLKVGDVNFNTEEIITKLEGISDKNVDIALFPELCLTGYTCGDLFFQKTLFEAVKKSLTRLCKVTKELSQTIIIGAPIIFNGQGYNCGVVISYGTICGIVPKTFLPIYNEFYEKRWFSNSEDLIANEVKSSVLGLDEDYMIPVGRNLIFNIGNETAFGIEICEDSWAPVPTGNFLTINGAEIIFNLSASNEVIGKRAYRRDMVRFRSGSSICAYQYTSAGCEESTTDLIFSGHSMFCENGTLLCENKEYIDKDYIMINDFDLGKIKADRLKNKSFKDSASIYGKHEKSVFVDMPCRELKSDGSLYNVGRSPFVPENREYRIEKCMEMFTMQSAALARRIEQTGCKMVVGVSGGLDSTLALLVCVRTAMVLNRPLTDIIGITMPCFGTSGRTYNNSIKLMKALGIAYEEINIKDACIGHFKDIGHDINKLDLTYENSQARERTQVLMDYAGKVSGLVVGTGDLSELALGWCTYNGDHMSMYAVNSSVPKTLIKWIIDSVIEENYFPQASEVLRDIIDTPISPELLPPDESGKITQETEDIVGPYELHDFFLFYVVRYGYEPAKIYYLAKSAFKGVYDNETILKWLKNFYRRFFTQQFKRSCQPDGVKVGNIALSPRGDWRMPSDASVSIWIDEVEKL